MTEQYPDAPLHEAALYQYPDPPTQPYYTQQFQAQPIASAEQRRQAMASAIVSEVARGGRVESQTEFSATIVTGSKPNHLLHLVLSIVSCGAWLVIWPFFAIFQTEHRASLQVNEYGQILRQQLS